VVLRRETDAEEKKGELITSAQTKTKAGKVERITEGKKESRQPEPKTLGRLPKREIQIDRKNKRRSKRARSGIKPWRGKCRASSNPCVLKQGRADGMHGRR